MWPWANTATSPSAAASSCDERIEPPPRVLHASPRPGEPWVQTVQPGVVSRISAVVRPSTSP